jgi:hypothetical protein
MRTLSIVCVAVLVSVLTSLAWADIAPPNRPKPQKPRPRPGQSQIPIQQQSPIQQPAPGQLPPQKGRKGLLTDAPLPTLDKDTQIRMEKATVDVDLRKAPVKALYAAAAGGILAKVDCQFEMHCVQASKSPTTFTMAFPLGSEADLERATKFKVTIDGKEPAWLEQGEWELATPAGKKTYFGYFWPASVENGAKQHVTVSYTTSLSRRGQAASFTYVLCSGAAWHGPIGQETVRVKADQGLAVESQGTQFQPQRQADGLLVWEIRNATPTEDIQLTIK